MPKETTQNHIGVPGTDLQAALQGGLRGRFARGFGVLMGAVDTLERYLTDDSSPDVQSKTTPLLQVITQEIKELERLTSNAADLALDVNLPAEHPMELLELTAYLRTLCETANQELARLERPARVEMAGDWPETLFAYGNGDLLNTLFANLFTNSVRAKADARITLAYGPERQLLYRDDGPGLSAEARTLIQGETASAALMRQSGTGLLLVAAYANEMGWTLTAEPGRNMLLTIQLPPYKGPVFTALQGGTENDRIARRQLSCLRREFEATLS